MEGLNFHDFCVFLFMIQMSRGYEDEQVILQIFLMFVNKQDEFGRFGALGHLDDNFEMARISEADLRVLLSCTLYY